MRITYQAEPDYELRNIIRMFEQYGNVRILDEGGGCFLALKPGISNYDFVEMIGTRAEIGRYVSTARAIVHERGKNGTVGMLRHEYQ